VTGPATVLSVEPLDDGFTQVSLKVPGRARKVRVIVPPQQVERWAALPEWDVQGVAARAVRGAA